MGNNGFINGVQVLVSDRIYSGLTGMDTYAELCPGLKDGADRTAFNQVLEEYVLAANMTWGEDEIPIPAYISYTRIKEWRYTEKGYFCYELCVPEPPEVSEIVDGSCLVRVRPLPEKCREMSEKCVLPLGYQGNNLLCSNWDRESLDKLDYNGIYEYFYGMKYDRRFEPEQYPHGIPAEEFEDASKLEFINELKLAWTIITWADRGIV